MNLNVNMRLILISILLSMSCGCTVPRQVAYTVSFMANRPQADYVQIEQQAGDRPVVDFDAAPQPYWTAFRGPNGDGVYAEGPIRTEWPAEGLPELWRRPCGAGFGSVIVAEGLVITLEQRREKEAVVAYALDTGREVWTYHYPTHFKETLSGEGPRSTPAYANGRVFSLGAKGRLSCLHARTGQLIWTQNVLADADADNLDYGLAASPLIHGDQVIVTSGKPRSAKGAVLAYALADGVLRWQSVSDEQAYASPALLQVNGQDQLVVHTATRTVGLDLGNGVLLWENPWHVGGGLSCSQPTVVGSNRILLTGGYGKGSTLLEVSATHEVKTVWNSSRLKTRFNPVIVHEGYIYGLDEGIMVCLDAETAKRKWKAGRYGYGQLIRVGNHLVFNTQKGDCCLVELSPEAHQERGRFSVFEAETLNTPAIAHGNIILRNGAEMVCFDANP